MLKISKWLSHFIQICFLGSILSITSCRTYYGDGLAGGVYTHMQSPMSNDEGSVSRNYIGGKYNQDVNYYENEKNESAELSFHHAVSDYNITYAFGAFAFLGNYQVNDLPNKFEELNGDHAYYGAGFRAKVAYNLPLSSKLHWRIIGVQSSWHFETGDYSHFKDKLRQLDKLEEGEILNSGINSTHNFTNLCFYPYTELAIKIGDSWQLTPQFGFGFKLNEIMALRGFTGINISYKGFHVWGTIQEVGMSLDRLVFNDFEARQMGNNNHFQLGMAFSF